MLIFWRFFKTIYKRKMYHSSRNCVPFLFLRISKYWYCEDFLKRFINEEYTIPFSKNFKILILWGFFETIYKQRMYHSFFLRISNCWYFEDFSKRFLNEEYTIPLPKNFKMSIFWDFFKTIWEFFKTIYKRRMYHSSRNYYHFSF